MINYFFEDTMVTSNWQELEKTGREGCPILFPIGVIEEHGPHLPLGTDIFRSVFICKMVKEKLKSEGKECVIAPPYYWGVNHCTSGFPGSFSLKPETMQQVLVEIFENLKNFGFSDIYCFNNHGDAVHVKAIVEAIMRANRELGIHARLVVESMDLGLYGWRGDEEYLLVSDPYYHRERYDVQELHEQGFLDIHAGAFETAVMNYLCPEQVDLEKAGQLEVVFFNRETMKKWLQGGEAAKEAVPLGYTGYPAGYGEVSRYVEEILMRSG